MVVNYVVLLCEQLSITRRICVAFFVRQFVHGKEIDS